MKTHLTITTNMMTIVNVLILSLSPSPRNDCFVVCCCLLFSFCCFFGCIFIYNFFFFVLLMDDRIDFFHTHSYMYIKYIHTHTHRHIFFMSYNMYFIIKKYPVVWNCCFYCMLCQLTMINVILMRIYLI